MSKTFGYAICNNKITQILHGSKAVWYDDDGNRHVEGVRYIEADNCEQAKEFIKQGGSLVAVAENATTTQARPEPLNMAKARAALVQVELFLSRIERHGHPTLNPGDRCDACEGTEELRELVCAALAEPYRNCDKYPTHKEALDAWLDADPKESGCCDEWFYKIAKESEAKP